MLKHKKFLLLSLLVPVFIITSCKKAKEDYPIHHYGEEGFFTHLNVTGEEKLKKEYKSGEKLNIDALTIEVSGHVTTARANEKKDILNDNTYFVCANEDLPTNTIIGKDYKASTNVESSKFNFYIAAAIKNGESYEVYVSQKFTITIKNDDAIKPWVWYVVTAVVVCGVVGMVMFVRHRKLKQEEK